MDDDRKLLEAAARAAGYEIYAEADDGPAIDYIRLDRNYSWMPMSEWNPLTDDGDALRLAVKLDMQIWRSPGGTVSGMPPSGDFWHRLREPLEPDPYAATRRAIVRAAAAMGGGPTQAEGKASPVSGQEGLVHGGSVAAGGPAVPRGTP